MGRVGSRQIGSEARDFLYHFSSQEVRLLTGIAIVTLRKMHRPGKPATIKSMTMKGRGVVYCCIEEGNQFVSRRACSMGMVVFLQAPLCSDNSTSTPESLSSPFSF